MNREKLESLAKEYRSTMDSEVLHSWAQEVVSAVQSPAKSYIFHWDSGKEERLSGEDAADALNRAGYGRGALAALDYFKEVAE